MQNLSDSSQFQKSPSSLETMDRAIATLKKNKNEWVNDFVLEEKIHLLKTTYEATKNLTDKWVRDDLVARQVPEGNWDSVASIFGGPLFTLRTIRLYIHALEDIQRFGYPRIPGSIKTKDNGQLSLEVFPVDLSDKILFLGFKGEVWLEPGFKEEDLPKLQATAYHQKLPKEGKVSLVLGAGNISGITLGDILHKLFKENQVVLLKLHPVTEYLGDILKIIFSSFIEKGFLQIVYGGISEGKYLTQHPDIDEIHVTGSVKTFENIVFGEGEEGEENKKKNHSITKKRVTGELSNISPVIIVPGPWKEQDVAFQAENIAAGLMINNGFNCNANRILIQYKQDELRNRLLSAFKTVMKKIQPNPAYYPGSQERLQKALKEYPDAFCSGGNGQCTPWTLVENLDPKKPQMCFKNEIFGSFIAEVPIEASSIEKYLDDAVDFCNERLWGNLNATIIVHPNSLKDPKIRAAVDRAIENLKYGTVSINHFPGISFFTGTTGWGGFSGASIQDIQSGIGMVQNILMLEHIQKSVFKGPFKVWPKPAWFPTNPKSLAMTKGYLEFEKERSIGSFLKMFTETIF